MKKMTGWMWLIVVSMVLTLTGVTRGGVVRVDTNGTGNGSSWSQAASLSNALTIAQNGDELWLAEGTYSNNWDGTTSFKIATNDLILYGGFTNGMENLEDRDWTNHPAILNGYNTNRVMEITASNAAVDGLTLQNGKASGNGLGIYKTAGGTLTMANCRIQGNVLGSGSGGGAYFSGGGTVMLTNCIVSGNRGTSYVGCGGGVGVYASGVNLTVIDCTFSNNGPGTWCRSTSGGAMRFGSGALRITRSAFVNNNACASSEGGTAIYLDAAATTMVSHCLFRANNYAQDNQGVAKGGTLYMDVGSAATVTVENCTFANNTPGASGGALYAASGSLVFKNSIAWSNATATSAREIYRLGGNIACDYVCLTGVGTGYVYGTVSLIHVMTNNPQFAGAADFHLRSTTGRWDSVAGIWTNDAVTSPCIDAGDPAGDYAGEPVPNGSRVNLGRYGNTAEASKSPAPVAPVVTNRGATTNCTSATLSGELVSGTPADITIYYGLSPDNLQNQSSVALYPPQSTGFVFSASLKGLLPNQTYYYACYATNAAGTNWAAVSSFTSGDVPPGGGAGIIHVKSDATGAETGLNWMDAYPTLTKAVAGVSPGTNELWMAGSFNDGATVTLNRDMTVYGGFTGTETNRNQRSLANATAITGQGVRQVIDITASNVVFDGLTIQNGSAASGAGIYKAVAGTLTLANCRFEGNSSSGGNGGGAHFGGGTVTLTNCTFANNTAASGAYGIGFYATASTVTLANCTFTDNRSAVYSECHGIGFYASGSDLAAINCVFTRNGANSSGGGRDTRGGAIEFANGTLSITNCTFATNDQCVLGGSAIYLGAAARATIRNSLFHAHKYVAGDGYSAGKGANTGGTVHMNVGSSTTVTVENCTFYTNAPGMYGGAIRVDSGTLTLKNSILWNDAASVAGSEIYATNGTAVVTVSYSDLTGTNDPYVVAVGGATLTLGPGLLTADPLFASATDLHLKSMAGRWDPGSGSWTNDLKGVTSPCIDAGDPASPYSNEPYPNGRRVNLGAYGNTWQASKTFMLMGSVFIIQ